MYLSNIVDPNTPFGIPDGNLSASLSPTNTVQGRRPLNGHTRRWNLPRRLGKNL